MTNNTYTVFAAYEDDGEPYATVVEAETPDKAAEEAQRQCNEDNGLALGDENMCLTLTAIQVVKGEVEVVL